MKPASRSVSLQSVHRCRLGWDRGICTVHERAGCSAGERSCAGGAAEKKKAELGSQRQKRRATGTGHLRMQTRSLDTRTGGDYMRRFKDCLLTSAVSTCCAAAALGGVVHAEDAPSPTPPSAVAAPDAPVQAPAASVPSAGTPSATQVDTGGASQLEAVVVTANKRAESTRNVAGQVSALSGRQLDTIKANTFQDFASYIPGVNAQSQGAGANEVVIRGVTSGAQASSTVGTYIDDVPLGSSTAFGYAAFSPDVAVFDLNRVEVLSGPQGT